MRIELGFTLEFQIYEPVHLGGGGRVTRGFRLDRTTFDCVYLLSFFFFFSTIEIRYKVDRMSDDGGSKGFAIR